VTMLRVVVIDDSQSYRALLAAGIDASKAARVVAHASGPAEALSKVAEFQPDVVTLDIEMPGGSGLELLPKLKARSPRLAVVMVSSHTRKGAEQTLRALELGAYDFIAKPISKDAQANRELLHEQLKRILSGLQAALDPPVPAPRAAASSRPGLKLVRPPVATAQSLPEVVVIGASTGGPAALGRLLPRLPKDLPVPVLVVQHMPPVFTASFAESLAARCPLPVVEATQGMLVRPGTIIIAPGGRHLRVIAESGVRCCELTEDPPENYCRPAVDYLFRSAAAVYGERTLAVILTGMGRDGTAGLKELRRHPVKVIGQSEATCTVYGMPREAKAAGLVDLELSPEEIAAEIVATVQPRRRE
jgi:two-component system, chemotaxis family, protein-glutamate methylesterase/glutaminase